MQTPIMAIRVSVSGIRGKFDELTPNKIDKFVRAFATYCGGGQVAIAADSRPSGKFIREAVIASLNFGGVGVLDYGILPTPVLQWIIRQQRYAGGISITGGHNAFNWNSLIFLNREGSYLNHYEGEEFFNLVHAAAFPRKHHDELGTHEPSRRHLDDYFAALGTLAAAGRPLKFVIDCSQGFGGDFLERLSRALDVKLIPIFCDGGERLPKDPEPTVANAAFLATMVRETSSDGGFLLNSDASRVLVVDESGRALPEELTLPVFARIALEQDQQDIVTNYSTSKLVDGVAARFGVKVFRTDVGQPYVVHMVRELQAHIGGEGSGSVVYTPFSFGFDSFLFIRTVSDYLKRSGRSLAELAAEFSLPEIFKESFILSPERIYGTLERIEALYNRTLKLKDGFYVESGSDWLCVRASSTIAMIRLVGEGQGVAEEIRRIRELLA